ncbi:MAG: sigma-70 family RNA polymerase sigma factor [Balneolaceae bacterium]|nr:sigma-70 family RNA polymerase sigma factor [Balneolaceae bacterium]
MGSGSSEYQKKEILDRWKHLKDGDRSALDWLFRYFYQELYDYANRLIDDKELVRDSIQDLFLSLWIKRERLVIPDSVKAYLLVSLRNLIYDQLKDRRKKDNRNKIIEAELFERTFEVQDVHFKEDVTEELKQQLIIALNQLNNKQRETLFLRYYNGLSNKEIAEVIGINHQSVKNNISRAIINLRGIVKTLGLSTLIVILRSMEVTG